MSRRLVVLILLFGLILPALPTLTFPEYVAAANYTTFHQIDPAAQVAISHNDTWNTINATTYGVPLGATGILYTARNWEGSGGVDEPFGFRKHGSTDDRTNPLWEHTPTWGAVGVDEDCLFDLYAGSATANFGFWIIGYTTVGVTFFTNAIDISSEVYPSGSFDIDLSDECPGATGVIIEVVGPSRGETMWNFALMMKGGTGFAGNAADHLAPGCIVGCDANQVISIYNQGGYEFYVLGYIYDGAVFYSTPVDQGPNVAGSWQDLTTTLPANAVMGFYEWHGSGSAYCHDIREKGSAWTYGGLDNRHCWAYAGCDANGKVEGYVQHTSVDYWLVGYAIPGSYCVSTQDATNVTSTQADFHGTVVNDNGEDVEKRGFQWGLTETPTWEWYETGSSTFWINPSSTNYMYNAAAGYSRLGQNISNMAYTITSLSFYLERHDTTLPISGNISYRIDTGAGANIFDEVLCDASAVGNVSTVPYKMDIDPPLELVGNYRLYTQWIGGDVNNYLEHGYRGADVGAGVYTRDIGPISAWSDSSTQESGIEFEYETSGSYAEESYNYTATGLNDNTQYYYRAFIVTDVTTHYGRWVPFGTANQPVVTTLPASSVATTTARLNSLIDADGDEDVTVRFGWGNSTQSAIGDYQFSEELTETYVEGEHPYLDISGLDASSTYYYRVEGENVNGSDLGDEETFTTGNLTGTPTNFRGIPYATETDLTWDLMAGASEYMVRYAFGGYVTNVTQGLLVYLDTGASTTHEDLSPGTTYFYTLWAVSGSYYSSPAYLALTTTAGAGGGPSTGITAPTEIDRWVDGTDHTNVANLGFVYNITNDVADSVGVPQGSFWFAAWVLISVAVGFFLYIVSKGKMMVGTMVMAALLVLGWQMELVPGYVPFIGGLLVAFSFISHKEVYKG